MNLTPATDAIPPKPHHQLQAWQSSMALVKAIHTWSASFPTEEKFALSSQIRRAAVSIPSNIAEGAARTGSKEFAHDAHGRASAVAAWKPRRRPSSA